MDHQLPDLQWELHPIWKDHGLTLEWMTDRAHWMFRECGAPGAIDSFFSSAGRLLRLCAYDFYLVGPMFFHTVIGLEAMLRVHYTASEKDPFRHLFARAVEEGVFHDGLLSGNRPLWDGFQKLIGPGREERIKQLEVLVPQLRNDYFHGGHRMAPDFLFLAIQMRELADALTMPRTPEWKRASGEDR